MIENVLVPILPERRGVSHEGYRLPMVDLADNDGELDIEVLPDAVTVKAETAEEKEEKKASYYRHERSYHSFQRTIPLPAEVKANEARASFKDGLLEVHLPKAEPTVSSKAVKVAIK